MLAVRNAKTELYFRLNNSNTKKFPHIAEALTFLPEETVIDGELAALNTEGMPDFNLMQNYKSAEAHLVYFAFDILFHKGKPLLDLPLIERRRILREAVKPNDRVQIVEVSSNAAENRSLCESPSARGRN